MTNILEETGYFWWSDLTIPTGYVAPEAAVVGKLTIDEEGQSHLELEGAHARHENNRRSHSSHGA